METMDLITITRRTFRGMVSETIELGTDCFIGHCGSLATVFGENGKVTKINEKYIYCTSESGSIVKWNVEKRECAGKWNKAYWFVNFNTTREYSAKTIKFQPKVWNSNKMEFEYK